MVRNSHCISAMAFWYMCLCPCMDVQGTVPLYHIWHSIKYHGPINNNQPTSMATSIGWGIVVPQMICTGGNSPSSHCRLSTRLVPATWGFCHMAYQWCNMGITISIVCANYVHRRNSDVGMPMMSAYVPYTPIDQVLPCGIYWETWGNGRFTWKPGGSTCFHIWLLPGPWMTSPGTDGWWTDQMTGSTNNNQQQDFLLFLHNTTISHESKLGLDYKLFQHYLKSLCSTKISTIKNLRLF